jgi:DNA-binding NtrC family response regulator
MSGQLKKAILVVDDEVKVCRSIQQALLCDAWEVDAVLSGEEALHLEDKKRHDVILVDLMMPGLSGLDLLKCMRAKNPSAKIIMITGFPTLKATVQSMEFGAFEFLPKPFLPVELREQVSRALEAMDRERDSGKG